MPEAKGRHRKFLAGGDFQWVVCPCLGHRRWGGGRRGAGFVWGCTSSWLLTRPVWDGAPMQFSAWLSADTVHRKGAVRFRGHFHTHRQSTGHAHLIVSADSARLGDQVTGCSWGGGDGRRLLSLRHTLPNTFLLIFKANTTSNKNSENTES